MVTLNRPAVTNDSPCDSTMPATMPTASDAQPTSSVSYSTMRVMAPGPMPSVR